MELYGYWRSSAAYRVRIALNLKGLEARHHPVNLRAGEHRQAGYRQLNPQGRLPVLVDEGVAYTQSIAILEYLEERYPEPPILPPDPQGRARVRAIVQLVASDIHPVNNLGVLQYLLRELGADEEQKVAWYRHWIYEGFDALEAMLAGDARTGRFCHEEAPGMADLCLVPQIYNARRFECDLSAYPTITRIDAACMELDVFKRAEPEAQEDALQ